MTMQKVFLELCVFIVSPTADSVLSSNLISTDPDAHGRGREKPVHVPYLSE